MKRTLLVLAACMALLLVSATPAQAAKYRGYVSCSTFKRDPDPVCVIGDRPGAIFQALRAANVRYRVCVFSPGGSRCAVKTTGGRGERSVTPINLNTTGAYTVTWKARGKIRARYSFKVRGEGV